MNILEEIDKEIEKLYGLGGNEAGIKALKRVKKIVQFKMDLPILNLADITEESIDKFRALWIENSATVLSPDTKIDLGTPPA